MDISVKKLLIKIENELSLAKGMSDEGRLREKVYSIKTLCELILDEEVRPSQTQSTFVPPSPPQQMVIQGQPAYQTMQLNEPKKLDLKEEANGDSLFDF